MSRLFVSYPRIRIFIKLYPKRLFGNINAVLDLFLSVKMKFLWCQTINHQFLHLTNGDGVFGFFVVPNEIHCSAISYLLMQDSNLFVLFQRFSPEHQNTRSGHCHEPAKVIDHHIPDTLQPDCTKLHDLPSRCKIQKKLIESPFTILPSCR